MTDLIARLAQIQNAHGGKIYRDMSMDEKLNMQEEVADLALDALAEWVAAIDAAKEGMDDYALLLTIHEKQQQARTILRELRGASLGEGDSL